MDLTPLQNKPAGPIISGGFNSVKICLANDILTFPDRDSSNKAVISDDIVFKTGKGWHVLYVTKEKQKLNEKGNGKRDNDSVTSTFTAKHPSISENIRQFLSEENSSEFFLLLEYDGADYPILLGRKNQPAFMDFEYDSGETVDDDEGNTLTFVSKGAYLSAIYKGQIENDNTVIDPDDTSPDVSDGTSFITSPNTATTEITTLDNAITGATYWIYGGSDTMSSTITNGGDFSLTDDMTLSTGSFIKLFCRGANDFVELARG